MLRPHLRGQTPESLAALWPDLELTLPAARRVMGRIVAEDRDDLEGVRGIKRSVLAELAVRGSLARLVVQDRRASAVDPFVKYLFRGGDGGVFEAVRIPLHQPRFSVCISSQMGCARACAFCETGRLGFARNLEAWEMVEQVLAVRRSSPERPVTGVVFQGQGEPFDNYDQVIRAAAILRHPCGGRIGGDRISISTVGVLPMIERYTDERHPYRLLLSLTSAFDERRAPLVPAGRRWSVAELARAMRAHAARGDGVVQLAWVLMRGVNTGADEAREIGRLFRGAKVRLSVIDVNDPTGEFAAAGDSERAGFFNALAAENIPFHRRYSGGFDIHAACGMLASSSTGGRAVAG